MPEPPDVEGTESMTDDAADPLPAEATCRLLVRSARTAALATAERANDAWPYASLVETACDHAGRPILLLSDLADHTKNFTADARVSLLFDNTAGLAAPLTGARATLQGRIAQLDEDDTGLRWRYLARHPGAADYAGFGDFNFYRVMPDRFHLVAGFGRIHWLDAETVLFDTAETAALAEREQDIVDHMNDDHADAVDLYAGMVAEDPGTGWRMTGIDPEGADLGRDGAILRLPFDQPVHDADSARALLVQLVTAARNGKKLPDTAT